MLTLTALLTTLSMAQKEALILGVSDYMGEKSDLGGVKKDIPRMENLFKSWGFNVTLLKDAQSMNLESYLGNYANLSANDSFIFYYSGHGYHIKDTNGDEPDGEDEALVLSDGEKNELFIDDALFGYLNAIKAKKMVVLDSCHSGTAFKNFGDKPRPKSITDSEVSGVMRTKAFRPQESKISSGEYIVFAAAQDQEESLDTSNGGLFTNAFLQQFKNGGASTEFMNIRQSMENSIVEYCKRSDSKAHHPKLSASDNNLKYSSINQFFSTKSATPPKVKKTISISGKPNFKEGELLKFTIDTNGNRGYLTIFSIESGEPFIMTQTANPVSGILNFQEDFTIKQPIECYKSCSNCPQETSSVYIILSENPVSKRTMNNKGLRVGEGMTGVSTKAFRERTDDSFEPIMVEVKFTIK